MSFTHSLKVRNFLLVRKGVSTVGSLDQRKQGEETSRPTFQPGGPVTMVSFYPSAVILEAEQNQHLWPS